MPFSGNGAVVEVGLTKPSNSREEEEGRNWEGIDPLRMLPASDTLGKHPEGDTNAHEHGGITRV